MVRPWRLRRWLTSSGEGSDKMRMYAFFRMPTRRFTAAGTMAERTWPRGQQ